MEREKTRPAWPVGCLCATKLAQQAQDRRKTLFLGVLGELFRGSVVVWGMLGELFRGTAIERVCWESFVPVGLLVRYKVLPAPPKRAEMGLFGRVGRVLYRLGCWCG